MLDLKNRDRAYIIAEAGTCHASRIREERLPKAIEYVHAAARAKADAVKFQIFATPIQPPDMFCWIEGDEDRSERWALSELTLDEWRIVKAEADGLEIDFLASVFQHTTVAWLDDLSVIFRKVASRAAATFPYKGAPVPHWVSTGMLMPPAEFIDRVNFIECESKYPSTMSWQGKYPGFSDHSANPEYAIDAMNRSCKLIEVHFYIDRKDAGPDLPASLTTQDLARICRVRDALAR